MSFQLTSPHIVLRITASVFSLMAFATAAHADIFQWEYINPADPSQGKQQSTTLAPDGAGVDAVPGANLIGRNLTVAYLIGADLMNADGPGSNLTNSELTQANLRDADFESAILTGANFRDASLTNAYLGHATLTDADFTGAEIRGANFWFTGITLAQLYSTASYQANDLSGIGLGGNNLAGWNFAGQNLTNADFGFAALTGADFSGAEVRGASFDKAPYYGGTGITLSQLYSTASYQAHDLSGIGLGGKNLAGANFSAQNLTNALFDGATLTGADFTGAEVRGASFGIIIEGTGITFAQLYSTASYQAHDLTGIGLYLNDLSCGNFADQNLTNASFYVATLTDADFTDAHVQGANFAATSGRGFTAAQLYSTASYQARNLTGIALGSNDLSGWNFAGQNLSNANIWSANLTGANFTDADMRGASFTFANLTGANFTDAEIRGAIFGRVGCARLGGCLPHGTLGTGIALVQLYSTASYQARDLRNIDFSANQLAGGNFAGQNLTNANFGGAWLPGADFTNAEIRGANFSKGSENCPHEGCPLFGTGITLAQLYSTASYQAHDLTGIKLFSNDLYGGNFVGQNLSNAYLGAYLTGVDFTAADARGAIFDPSDAIAANLIWPDGHIHGFELNAGGLLVVRDDDVGSYYDPESPPIPITVDQSLIVSAGGVLRTVFEADAWDSTISFAPGIPVTLGGTLELMFVNDVNLASQVGRTFDLFDWTGVNPTGAFVVSSPYAWDLSNLYTTGEVTLAAVPEPRALLPLSFGIAALVATRCVPRPPRAASAS